MSLFFEDEGSQRDREDDMSATTTTAYRCRNPYCAQVFYAISEPMELILCKEWGYINGDADILYVQTETEAK